MTATGVLLILSGLTLLVVVVHAVLAWRANHHTSRMADNIDKVTPGSDDVRP